MTSDCCDHTSDISLNLGTGERWRNCSCISQKVQSRETSHYYLPFFFFSHLKVFSFISKIGVRTEGSATCAGFCWSCLQKLGRWNGIAHIWNVAWFTWSLIGKLNPCPYHFLKNKYYKISETFKEGESVESVFWSLGSNIYISLNIAPMFHLDSPGQLRVNGILYML